ncbi:MAG: N-acetylglucosamine-6-phosphate deacetylase [Anaerolineae bacterium]
MKRLLITGGRVFTPITVLRVGSVLVEDGRIERVSDMLAASWAGADTVINAEDLLVAPGFVDLQVNGGFGYDFTQAPESIPEVAARLPQFGVTAFLPTIISAPLETYKRALEAITAPAGGARPLELHFEGPFLNPERAGAHDRRLLLLPDARILQQWEPLERVRMVTLAPELPGALELIGQLRKAGVAVALGHSQAAYAEAKAAFDAGARFVTHLFNAMRPLHHREPGLPGAALEDPRVRVGLIVDGVHLHPAVVRMVWNLKPPKLIALVTDAMAAAGDAPSTARYGEIVVDREAGTARLPDGTLAGSILTMDQALRSLVQMTECSPSEALQCVSTTPAAAVGWGGRKGWLRRGCDADIVLLTPEFRVVGTIIAGELVYWAGEPERLHR